MPTLLVLEVVLLYETVAESTVGLNILYVVVPPYVEEPTLKNHLSRSKNYYKNISTIFLTT